MRNVIDLRRPLGSVPIEDIRLDAKSRDDIPALLIGLQAIYRNETTRTELFRLLDARILPGRRRDTGRPGMDLWAVLVMGILKQGLRCDTDRLRETVNRHADVQAFLGHDVWFEPCRYALRNIRDNVELMTPELLGKVNDLIVGTGHKIAGKKPGAAVVGRCNSFVAETDIHHPTDFSLLWDSVRCLIQKTAPACGGFGVPGWQQWEHHLSNVRELYGRVRTGRNWKSRPDEVRAYLDADRMIADKAQASLATLRGTDCPEAALGEIKRLLGHARRFADQIDRRVLQRRPIPHGEKVFSIFEEHTRWIAKGKAGKKA